MATRTSKFTTTTTGSDNQKPVASLATYKIDALIGSIIQLDGRKSYDPEKQPLTWKWRFVQVPIGSTVADSGFRSIRPGGTAVSFIPDKIGLYIVELIVNDGELDSDPVTATVNIQITRVPLGENLIPDAHFLWNYISNFWNLVEDREVITTIWSSVIQSIGSDLITLWGTDNNKSLKTIQNTFQRRWQSFETSTTLLDEVDQRIIVGKTDSGTNGATGKIGEEPGIESTKVFYVPRGTYRGVTETDFTRLAGNYGAKGRVIEVNKEGYTLNRVSSENFIVEDGLNLVTVVGGGHVTSASSTFITSNVLPGQWLILKNGSYAGSYLVDTVVSETELIVINLNETSVSFATSESNLAFEVVKPYTVAVIDESVMPDGQVGVSWRIPQLLHLPFLDLEAAGVRRGDVLIFEVTRSDLNLSAELRTQVVCVDRNRLGFEFSLGDLSYDAAEVMDRDLIRQLMLDLRIVPPEATDAEINGAAEAFIAFMPVSINLATRPFTTYRITFKAKRIIHNSVVPFDDLIVSVPVLQEQIKDPPVVLRENLDYIVENGALNFVSGLFTPTDPVPDKMWAECVILDNSGVIEQNFGRLVNLSKDDLTAKQTRAPYLSAVRGLFFAYTNGPTVSNIRLGLQILLGLPFTEERGLILELQDEFTTDTQGNSLGRLLIEDVDDNNKRTGFRRLYFYPTVVGLEDNPATGVEYKVGDIVERFVPLSKGVEVNDYIKNPDWQRNALVGMEILKYFTFRVLIDSEVYDSNDITFAFDFVKSIKPVYTKVITTALVSLYDEIEVDDGIEGAATLRFYDNSWGLEACNKAGDDNQQGVVLWHDASPPFQTRTLHLLRDVRTYKDGTSVLVSSTTGWNPVTVRGHLVGVPVTEGDLLVILPGQPGAGSTVPGMYEISDVLSANLLQILQVATFTAPTTFAVAPIDEDLFEYGENLICAIVRRGSNPIVIGEDLVTTATDSVVTSASSRFKTDAVSPGDYLVIERGPGLSPNPNMGEYLVDAVIPFSPGPPIVPPNITETQLLLKTESGASPVFVAGSGQAFRVVRRDSQAKIVYGARTYLDGPRVMLEVLDPVGNPRDIFTPGMVGLTVELSNSEKPANDGPQFISEYINCGRVALDFSLSTDTDTIAQAIIHF